MTQRRASMQGLEPKMSAVTMPSFRQPAEKIRNIRRRRMFGSCLMVKMEDIMFVKIAAVSLLSLGMATAALAQSSSGGSSSGGTSGSGSGAATGSGSATGTMSGSGGTNNNATGNTNDNPAIVDPNTTNSTINSGNSTSGNDSNDCRREPQTGAANNAGPSGNVVTPDNSAACPQ